ncbi:MAG: DNA-directed RNA polymerase subunit H [archaeon]
MNHVLVPIHEIIAEEEAKEIIKKFGQKKEKFPQILLSDPVIEELAAKKGDLIRITRESPTAGKSTYYRLVVK